MVAQNLGVGTVDRRPVSDIRHVDSHTHKFIEPGTGSFEDMADVFQCLVCLFLDTRRNGVIATCDKGKLPRDEDEPVCPHGLAIMAAWLRSKIAADVLHSCCVLSGRKICRQEAQQQAVELVWRIQI